MNPLFGPILDLAGKVFDRIFPDPVKASEAKLELLKMQQAGEFKAMDQELTLAVNQAAINLEEAKSASIFKSGWRPAAGWLSVAGLFWGTIGQPVITWICLNYKLVPPPIVDTSILMTLLFGMLGLGTQRMYEKVTGVASK